jgi:cytochrome c
MPMTGRVRAFLIAGAMLGLAALAACDRAGNGSNGAEEANGQDGPKPENAAQEAGAIPPLDIPAPLPGDVTTLDGTRLASFTGNAEAGRMAFLRCKPCHATEPGVNSIGPTLHGIVGSPAATTTRFDYSNALRASGITWTPAKLNQFIERPRRVVPGSIMTFYGLRNPQDRADIIAYLATQ